MKDLLEISKDLDPIKKALGQDSKLYLVGGCVRDYFLNKETLYFIFRNISEKFQCIINL